MVILPYVHPRVHYLFWIRRQVNGGRSGHTRYLDIHYSRKWIQNQNAVALYQELRQMQNLVGGTRKRAETKMYLSQIFAGHMTLRIMQIGTIILFVSY